MYATLVILCVLGAVFGIWIFADSSMHPRHMEYKVLGYHMNGDGILVYTISVQDHRTKKEIFFGNIPASEYTTQPYNDHKWHIVPEYDRHLYLKKD